MTLLDKIEESLSILRYACDTFEGGLAVTFSGGKDSLVVLHLLRTLLHETIPFPVFTIDTSVKFAETIKFRDQIARDWNLNLVVIKNEAALKTIEIAADKKACCEALKIGPLRQAIVSHNLKALITGIRWDESEARADEVQISVKDTPPHTRIHPLLHFRESDVWDYIHAFGLPYCPLYDQGYRSLSCMPCTRLEPEAASERQGRAPEKEEIMKELRLLGYF